MWVINSVSLCDVILDQTVTIRTRVIRCETLFKSKFRILYSRIGCFSQLQICPGKHSSLKLSINALQKSKHTHILMRQPCSHVTIYTRPTTENGIKQLYCHSSFIDTSINQRYLCKKLGETYFFIFAK